MSIRCFGKYEGIDLFPFELLRLVFWDGCRIAIGVPFTVFFYADGLVDEVGGALTRPSTSQDFPSTSDNKFPIKQ